MGSKLLQLRVVAELDPDRYGPLVIVFVLRQFELAGAADPCRHVSTMPLD
jgi:hypothetical protein